jgi:hypothetical protein
MYRRSRNRRRRDQSHHLDHHRRYDHDANDGDDDGRYHARDGD